MKEQCPAETLLKQLSGKWKPQIFRLASTAPFRFNELVRALQGASRQAIAMALKEMENDELLIRSKVREKPLHVEYCLSTKAKSLLPLFLQLEILSTSADPTS